MKKEIKKNDHLYYSSDPASYGEERDFPNVIGWKVKASNDQVIGTVNQLVVSKDANKVVYLDVETDQKIKNSEEELYGQPEDFSGGKFTNKDGENHLIIPIGLATVDEDLKSIKTEEIDFQTFTKTKRIKKDVPISREYELIILNTYRNNTGKEEKDPKNKNKIETNKDNTTMEKSGTTTDHNISDKKRDKDPVRNKNGEEIEKIKFSEDAQFTSRPKESDAERKSKKDGVIGEIGKENRINKPSDNTNITASPGEIVDDSRDIESEVDVKMRKENIQKSSKNSTDSSDSSKDTKTRAKSKITGKEDKKQKTLEVPGTSVNPTNKKETHAESKKATGSSGKSTSDSGSSKSKSSGTGSGSGSNKNSSNSNRGTANSSSDKGSYVTMDYHEYTKDELYQRAQEVDLEGRSQMNKDELVKALYDSHTKEELYDRASEADISGRSKMSKTQLINALQRTDNDKSSSGNSTKSSGTNSSSSQSKSSGSTSSKSSSSSSSSSGTDYYRLTREELYEKAKQKDIEGRSQMSKDELLEALYEDHTREDLYEKASRANIKGRSKMSKKKLIDELKKS